MKKSFCLVVILFMVGSGSGQTYVSGMISNEVWTQENSPYVAVGDILVDSLTIEPGVDILFNGDYTFEVTGIVIAIGTETDSINFSKPDSIAGWQGIYFNSTAQISELAYCRIEHAINSGIRIHNSSIQNIHHCTIANNSATNGGGINGSSVTLDNCTFLNNTASSKGGSIYVDYGIVNLTNCEFLYNTAGMVYM